MGNCDYHRLAASDADAAVQNFADEILEQLLDKGEASADLLNDYPNGDSYHHENHVDRDYDLHEGADLIEQLDEFEETDSGLWEGCDMRRTVAACAAFTYGNAVYSKWADLIGEINSKAEDIIDDYDEKIADEIGDDNKEVLEEEKEEVLREMIENITQSG